MVAHIGEGGAQILRKDIRAFAREVAAGIAGNDRHAVQLSVRLGQRDGERTAGPGVVDRRTVIGDAQRGERRAVAVIGDRAGHARGVGLRVEGDHRGGGIHHAVIGKHKLVKVDRADALRVGGEGKTGDPRCACGQREGELLPAGKVQIRGVGAAGVGLQREHGAAGVAEDPEVHAVIACLDGVIEPDLRAHAGVGGIVQSAGGAAAADIAFVRVLREHRVHAGVGFKRLLKGVERAQRVCRDRHGNGQRGLADAYRQRAAADRTGGGKDAVFIHSADIAVHAPGEAPAAAENAEMLIDRLRAQGDLVAAGERQRGNGFAVPQKRNAVGVGDHADLPGGVFAAAARTHGDRSGRGRGEDITLHAAAVGRKGERSAHGDVIRIHGSAVQLDLGAGEAAVSLRGKIDVMQRSGGLAGGDKEHMVGHGAQRAFGGLVGKRRLRVGGHRGKKRCGAAAVKAHRRDAAKLDQALGDLRKTCADAVARLAAVDRVEDQRAVGGQTDRRARRAAGGQTGADLSVVHKLIQRADHIRHTVPLLIVRTDADSDALAAGQREQRVGVACAGIQICGEDVLVVVDDGVFGIGQHLVDHKLQLAADAQRTVGDGADDLHAGFARAGGAAGVEGRVIQEDAVAALAHIVERKDGKLQTAFGLSGHAQLGLAHDRRAVVVKADGVAAAAGIAQHAVRHHAAERNAGGGVVIVAVDARHHAVSLLLKRPGGGGDGGELRGVIAAGDNGRDAAVRRIDDIVLLPQVGVRVAPERAGGKLRAFVDRDGRQTQIVAERHGGVRRQRRGGKNDGKGKRDNFAHGSFHSGPPLEMHG